MSLSGTLSTMPLPDLLQWLATAAKTGTLRVERNKVRKCIEMREGRVVGVSTDDPPQRLGQYLISRELISEEQLREALAVQLECKQHLGTILVEAGVLSPDDLSGHLESKAEETIYSLFDWTDGSFRFEEGLASDEYIFPVDLQVQDVLLRGLKRYDEMRRIRQIFHDPAMILRYTSLPPGPEIFANRMARMMYSSIDGDRSLGEILLHVHGSEYIVYKFIYELHRNGFIEIAGLKAGDAAPSAKTDRQSVVLATVAAGAAEASAAPAASAAAVATEAPPVPFDEIDPFSSPADSTPGDGPLDLQTKLALCRQLISKAAYEDALDLLDRLYKEHPNDDSLRRLTAEAEASFVDRAYRHIVPPDKVPVLAKPMENVESAAFSPHDYFLLSRIDGTWDVKSIIQIAPFREVDALRTLKHLRESGLIELKDPD